VSRVGIRPRTLEDQITARGRIRVILVDGHGLIHDAVRSLLDAAEDTILVGSTKARDEGLKLACETIPDVAVIEIPQGIMDGLLLVQQIVREVPLTNIVVLSTHEDHRLVRKAFDLGVKAYVSKRSHGEHLLRAIRAAAEGGVYTDPAVAPATIAQRGVPIPNNADAEPTLTAREVEVVRLIAQGYAAKEIGGMLGITVKSVATYKARACEKLGRRTRRELVLFAETAGWLEEYSN
jgi:DNA-binding NarL/FixJ family response regulator